MSRIHIRQVLALMDTYEVQGKPVGFSLKFVKEDGEVRLINKCAKGWKNPNATGSLSNFKYNVKSKDIVLIRDINFIGKNKEKGRTISVKIDGIIQFNGLTVFH
jgi:hypothetical protein